MKKFMLKQWYPSLDERLEVGDIGDRYLFEFGNGTEEELFSVFKGGRLIYIPIQELHPDFWELIEGEEKPLFITEDGVEVFEGDKYYVVSEIDFVKYPLIAKDIEYSDEAIRFKHESNADEYIWRNKRVFSYQDMMKAKHSIILTYEDIEKAAKERSKE